MKITTITTSIFFILSVSLVGSSYGQTSGATAADDSKITGAIGAAGLQDTGAQEVQKPPEVLLQLQLRNSDGQLLAYIEGRSIVTIRPNWLNQYLDTIPNKYVIVREGHSFELIQFERFESPVTRTHSMAMYTLWAKIDGTNRNVLTINHDAYQVEPGDTLKVYWTIIRPV